MLARGKRSYLTLAIALVASGSCDDLFGPRGNGGAVLWMVPSGAPTDGTPHDPVANADLSMAYFVTPDYRLRKIRGSDGWVMWDVPVGGAFVTVPGWNAVLAGAIVAVVKVDVFAFDTVAGVARWTYVAPDLEETGYSALASDGETVYAAGRTARIHAINASSGIARWVADLREGQGDVGALNPTYADGVVFVCTRTLAIPIRGTLWALDAATGAVRWSYRFQPELPQQGSSCYGPAVAWNDLVIVPQEDGRVFAFDRESGAVRWTAPRVHDVAQSLGDHRWAAIAGNTLLVTNSSTPAMLVAYDPASGAERWRATRWGGSLYPPVMDESVAYVDHGWIFVSYDVASGKVHWQTGQSFATPDPPVIGRAVIANDRIYVGGMNGSYALRK